MPKTKRKPKFKPKRWGVLKKNKGHEKTDFNIGTTLNLSTLYFEYRPLLRVKTGPPFNNISQNLEKIVFKTILIITV